MYVCSVTKKSYVGWSVNLKKRWIAHCSAMDNTVFHKAIRKYGRECFGMNILFKSTDIEEVKQKEIEFIAKFNTMIPQGYNMNPGGTGYEISRYWKGKKNPYVSESNRRRKGEKKPSVGDALRGRKRPEHGEKLKGRKRPDVSIRMMGNKYSPDISGDKNPMRRSEIVTMFKGDKNPSCRVDVKKKKIETRRNNGQPWHSEETKQKIRTTLLKKLKER